MPRTRRDWIIVTVVSVLLGTIWIGITRVEADEINPTGRPPSPDIGHPAPEFSLAAADGSTLTLDDLKGQPVLINFWATWCPPCLEEIPIFVRLQQQMGARGLQFVGIAIDERDKVVNFARRNGINYPIMIGQLDAIELSNTAGNERGGLPYTLILDRSGEVVSQHYGALTEQELVTIVAELL